MIAYDIEEDVPRKSGHQAKASWSEVIRRLKVTSSQLL
jgi:hypothetical protein